MVINAFSDPNLFRYLSRFNYDITQVFHRVCQEGPRGTGGGIYYYKKEPQREISHWFDVTRLTTIPLPMHYPNIIDLNFDPKFCLLENYPNYPIIFLIYHLFANRKDVMIEDCCCGQAKLAFYLSFLGFKNFSLIDNFSQMRPELLEETMKQAGIDYRLNAPIEEVKPVVYTQVSFPTKVREVAPTVELVCLYSIMREFIQQDCMKDFKFLCSDSDDLILAYARSDKLEEFQTKLEKYKC